MLSNLPKVIQPGIESWGLDLVVIMGDITKSQRIE
jgi:hypothetical protein